jgi:potassium/sodium efflux P-type ATPase
MVITHATQIDGTTQPIVSEGQESQDPDEPPLPRLNSSYHEKDPGESRSPELKYASTANNSVSDTIGNGSIYSPWGHDPDTAHTFDGEAIAAALEVDPINGLSIIEAAKRLEANGPNKLDDSGSVSIAEVLLKQVSNSLTIVLVIAMALSYGTLDFIEGAVISAVILLNIVLGFVQDYQAEKDMKSLLSLAAPSTQVIRNGKIETPKVETLVVGDIVQLVFGFTVPADLRLLTSENLEIDEATLTGESLAVSKDAKQSFSPDLHVSTGDKTNMAFSSTVVTKGRATGIVVATGSRTQVGSVAASLAGTDSTSKSSNVFIRVLQKMKSGGKKVLGLVGTPMQVKLSKFAILLFALAVLLAIIVFSANKWDLHNEVVLYGICVAVAVIPESLIAVMTITIATGAKAMARGNVVIRNMAALEAIGGVTNICSDKTGTLTQGKMLVHQVWVPEFGTLSVQKANNILDPGDGEMVINNVPLSKNDINSQDKTQILNPLLNAIALCNFARVFRPDATAESSEKLSTPGNWTSAGDPTETALQVLAMRFGRGKDVLLSTGNLEQLVEHQFDSSLKRMSVAYKKSDTGTTEVFAKGACEAIIPTLDINENEKAAIVAQMDHLASEGLRVLCIASRVVSENEEPLLAKRSFMESSLKFQGLVGIFDPPRTETLDAVKKCHRAGIAVHMLTGDHLSTATAIARRVGILSPETETEYSVMGAQAFDKLSNDEIDALPSLPMVLARCSPNTKVRMVEALKRRKAYCVMTGDGVNDAPALKKADVGIAMGINGTDVAKDASDMVLTDDNFASIVKAVEEGRRLFDNIQKFLMHLLISNISQVILLLIALAFKDGSNNSVFPLSPLAILWANMITSSFLALGLGMEEAQAGIMTRPPHALKTGVFTWELICDKMLYGTWAGILCLVSFIAVVYGEGEGYLGEDCNDGWNNTCDVVFRGRATVFAVLSFLLLVTAWEVKHFSRSLFNLDPARYKGKWSIFQALSYNRFLLWAVVGGFVVTFPVIYIPVINKTVFRHKGIGWEWGVVFGAVVCYVGFVEAWKAIKRRFGIWSGGDSRTVEGNTNV